MGGSIVHIVGARPNFMKAAPVIAAARSGGDAPILMHTGQHYDERMSEIFFRDLDMPVPDINLGIGSGSHARQTADLMVAMEAWCISETPQAIVVYGDVNSTLAAALVCAKLQIPLAHVEAGLRSFDRTMPEEVNRIVTDGLSSLLYVTSPEAMAHLASEGVAAERMRFVGNPMIDTLLRLRPRFDEGLSMRDYGLPNRQYAIVTLHRPANVDTDESASRLISALHGVADRVPIILPLHPRGRDRLERLGLAEHPGLQVVGPLGYLDFMSLIAGAAVVLTDSGGIQEETTVLGIPCLTLRDNTERPITITHGTNRLVGTDPDAIVTAAEMALDSPVNASIPPLWDGAAGKRIASDLLAAFS